MSKGQASVVETFAVPHAVAGMAAVTRSDDPNHALVFDCARHWYDSML